MKNTFNLKTLSNKELLKTYGGCRENSDSTTVPRIHPDLKDPFSGSPTVITTHPDLKDPFK